VHDVDDEDEDEVDEDGAPLEFSRHLVRAATPWLVFRPGPRPKGGAARFCQGNSSIRGPFVSWQARGRPSQATQAAFVQIYDLWHSMGYGL
jgi:hypothetical protein